MARSIWKGSLGFGLVNIGVELVPMEAPERLDFDLLDKRDFAPIGYRKVNKESGEEVDPEHIVRGFRVEGDRYVIVGDEDIKEANPKASKSIELSGFVPRESVPLPFFAKPYLLAPVKGSEKAYRLLLEALEDADRVAIGEVVVRTRQYTCAVYPHEGLLVAHLLRYAEELRKPADLGIEPPTTRVKPEEKKLARTLIESMEAEWDASEHTDTFRKDVLAMIRKRAKQGTKRVKAASRKAADDEPKVLDLVAALKRSVGETGKGARKKAGRTARTTRSKRSA
jgi:DNA end-binding protein Ku